MLSAIHWDPDPNFITLPFVGLPIVWYGVLFALGFFLGYYAMRRAVRLHFVSAPEKAASYTDRLLWCTVIGTVIGARLGYVLFYGLPKFLENPIEIFMIRQGGLASHGAAVGVLLAMVVFRLVTRKNYPKTTFLQLLDMVVIPTALIAVFIRTGNFINQEIVGTATTLPWGVLFGHPASGAPAIARHPVQLYEAAVYLCTFIAVFTLVHKPAIRQRTGILSGTFFLAVFGSRFLFEFVKEKQSALISDTATLHMGQLLSIPFVIVGAALLCYGILSRRPVQSES